MYREVRMIEITEVLRLWRAGVPKKRVAARLGLDPKTVRRYVTVAEGTGLRVGDDPVSVTLLLDVLLAPDAGLRYPNLTDHKGNVMYDVVRIQRALSEHAFVSSRPYARGRWVVVPFRFRVETREAGVRCDSFS